MKNEIDPSTGLRMLLVNAADWKPPREIPDGWIVVNAPRPLAGELTWVAEFRHGVHYAAAPRIIDGIFGWKADDAWRVVLITNAEVEARVDAHLTERDYGTMAELEVTYAEVASGMELPYVAA